MYHSCGVQQKLAAEKFGDRRFNLRSVSPEADSGIGNEAIGARVGDVGGGEGVEAQGVARCTAMK
jgi:hypothetical protein